MKRKLKKAVANVKDASKEVSHRFKAGVEHEKRREYADELTTGQKVKSFMKEDLENTKADVHKAKRKIRNKT